LTTGPVEQNLLVNTQILLQIRKNFIAYFIFDLKSAHEFSDHPVEYRIFFQEIQDMVSNYVMAKNLLKLFE
jgi:hypothetical protein